MAKTATARQQRDALKSSGVSTLGMTQADRAAAYNNLNSGSSSSSYRSQVSNPANNNKYVYENTGGSFSVSNSADFNNPNLSTNSGYQKIGQQGNYGTSQTIPVDSLGNTAYNQVASYSPQFSSQALATSNLAFNGAMGAEVPSASTTLSPYLQQMNGAYGILNSLSSYRQSLDASVGLTAAQEELNALKAEAEARNEEYLNSMNDLITGASNGMNTGNYGAFSRANLSAEQNVIQRQRSREMAQYALGISALSGLVGVRQQAVDAIIEDAKFEAQNKIDWAKTAHAMFYNDMTESQKLEYQTNLSVWETNQKMIYNLAQTALENAGSDMNLINGITTALQNGDLNALARYNGTAIANLPKTTGGGGFTLSSGQVRYDVNGNVIASNLKSGEDEQINIEQSVIDTAVEMFNKNPDSLSKDEYQQVINQLRSDLALRGFKTAEINEILARFGSDISTTYQS